MDFSERKASILLREINDVFKRYGISKGVGFVPDRLEIKLERAPSGVYFLVYREFFTYLPPEVMEVAMGNAVEFLSGMGISRDKIKSLNAGVEVTVEGDARVVYFPILEMLIQDRGIAASLDSVFESMKGSIQSLMELFDFAWAWNPASEHMWRGNVTKLNQIIEENPNMQLEIEEIVRRHSPYTEKGKPASS
jgi:hypothetical protein